MVQRGLLISRFIVGILFLFTGFAKGIDPVGLQYKLNDYIEALHINLLNSLVIPGSLLLPFAEFAIGIALLTGIFVRLSIKGAFVFMLIFTPLTFYIALKNPVTDCGCFGDALVITNWETFYKNIILISLVIFLLFKRENLIFLSPARFRQISFIFLMAAYLIVVCWSYLYEPILDFRPYKVGANIPQGMIIPDGAPRDIYQNSYLYRNRGSNEVKKFNDQNFPWKDTINWKFESMDPPLLVKKGYHPPIHDFSIQTTERIIVTDTYLNDSIVTFFVIAYDLERSSYRNQDKLNKLAIWAKELGYRFIALTSTSGPSLEKYQLEHKPSYDILFTDQTTLKTIIRSNPGLLLLRKGTILAKWPNNALPDSIQITAILNK
jgi:hypothetical protein